MRRRSRKRSTPASCNPSRRAVIKAPLFGQTWALLRLLGELGLPPVITRMSELFLRTLRDDPADAEVASHKLLIRAGYIRPVAPGLYSWLPLGLRVLRNIERVIRDEMNAIGGQEILFPALLPRAPYETTNRWTQYGDSVFRLKDRRGNDYLLGPTHEELFTLTVKGEYSSYKDFPLTLYQIQTKYRDEARPRAGILRAREFVMKDSYSFDIDAAGLKAAYHAHREAYQRIFDRLQVRYVIVSAVSGAMGGSASEEFLAESPSGEDAFVRCLESGYAANVEAVVTARPDTLPIDGLPEAVVHDTGDTPTIASLVAWANEADLGRTVTAADTLKNVLIKVRQPGGDTELLAIGVPGDREVDDKRLGAALEPADYALLDDDDFAKHPFLVKGYIGPKALRENNVRYLVDPRIVDGTSWITGADQPGRHVVGLVAGRDFTADGTIEAAEVREGDPSPDGAGPLVMARGIEIGHIFQLGSKYTDAFTADVLGEDGKPVRLTMGSYGIGVSRLVAVVAEQHHDELGLRWPSTVAPFDVHLVIANKDAQARAGATALPPIWIGWGLRCCWTTARHRPASSSKMPSCWVCPGSLSWGAAGRTAWSSCATGSAVRLASWLPAPRWPPISQRPSPGSYSSPPGKAAVMGQAPSTLFQRVAITALSVRAVEANTRSSAVSACSTTARQAVAPSFSIRTASRAASAALLTCMGSW
ncbi:prolyl-tRNA synthetase [Mycobacterium tuberculosis]|nr:prolyl-tRNA synthetase [Mycobacterium tuberculosis]